jgi:hypothetical protein
MVISTSRENMNKLIKRVTFVLTITVAMASSVIRTNASVIDLGERNLADRLHSINAAMAYIETDQGLPLGTLTFLNSFDADAGFENNGAVDSSHFGATLVNGGINANISWDLSTSGFQLSYVLLKDGSNKEHTTDFLYHLYGVTPDEVFNSKGDQFVTINGVRLVTYIAFFGVPGSPSVPEGGTTLVLLGSALGAIEVFRRTLLRRAT